jgi:rsbT co-antagonist protein RsbR
VADHNLQQLAQQVFRALQERVFDNQGFLQPKQLQAIAGAITQLSDPDTLPPADLGQRLSRQGLALASLHHAGAAMVRALLHANDHERAQITIERIFALAQAFYREDIQRIRLEQQRIQEAVRQAIAQREEQAQQLQAMIHELSTPIVPVYEGILVVPLIGAIDSRRSAEITTRLLESISEHHAATVILDITGVPMVDTAVAQHLISTTQAAGLLGVMVLLVGVNPEIAQTIVQLGVTLRGMVPLSNLEQGIAYALRARGLGILPLPHR